MSSPFLAASFATRAHRNQIRKDGLTPYVAHVFRVSLVIQHLFGIHDDETLCMALLHDTIEDTTTDYEDLSEAFGKTVADGVAMLTKDSRLPEAEREAVYHSVIQTAPWQVQVCKLADIYDNASDSGTLTPTQRLKIMAKLLAYMRELEGHVQPEAIKAYEIVREFVLEQAKS